MVAPGVAVPPWATETVLSPWMAADEARVSHVLPHVVWWKKKIYIYIYIYEIKEKQNIHIYFFNAWAIWSSSFSLIYYIYKLSDLSSYQL